MLHTIPYVANIIRSTGFKGPLQISFDEVAVSEALTALKDPTDSEQKVYALGFVAEFDEDKKEWLFSPPVDSTDDAVKRLSELELATSQVVGLYTGLYPGSPKVLAFLIGASLSSKYREEDLRDWFKQLQEAWKKFKLPVVLVSADQTQAHMAFLKRLMSSSEVALPDDLKEKLQQFFQEPGWEYFVYVGEHGYPLQPKPDTLHVLGIARNILHNSLKVIKANAGAGGYNCLIVDELLDMLAVYNVKTENETERELASVRLSRNILNTAHKMNKKVARDLFRVASRQLAAYVGGHRKTSVLEDGQKVEISEESDMTAFKLWCFAS